MCWETKKLCDLLYFDIHFNDLELSPQYLQGKSIPKSNKYIRSHRNIYMHVYSSIIHKQEKVWYMNYIYFKKTIKKKIFRKLKLNIHHGLENWSILKISDFFHHISYFT